MKPLAFRWREALMLHRWGWSIKAIAKELHVGERVVRGWLV